MMAVLVTENSHVYSNKQIAFLQLLIATLNTQKFSIKRIKTKLTHFLGNNNNTD